MSLSNRERPPLPVLDPPFPDKNDAARNCCRNILDIRDERAKPAPSPFQIGKHIGAKRVNHHEEDEKEEVGALAV